MPDLTAEEKLLPCPFCGGEPERNHHYDDANGTFFTIRCTGCGAIGGNEWNERQPPVPKPLVWEGSFTYRCVTAFGEYEVDNDCYWLPMNECSFPCDSIDHGKRLCEVDYQRRFRELCE